jgi:hypothetical protein
MRYDPRIWKFISDVNYDGSLTSRDVWLCIKWLFFYPGDIFIYLLVNVTPGLAHFLEISYNNYGGILSGTVSFAVWFIVIMILYSVMGNSLFGDR